METRVVSLTGEGTYGANNKMFSMTRVIVTFERSIVRTEKDMGCGVVEEEEAEELL